MRKPGFITAVIISGSILWACTEIQSLPDRPHIEFTSFKVFDTIDLLGNECKGGRLKFYFEDGDGDLGLSDPDYIFDDSVNMFFNLYRKTNGLFEAVADDDPLVPSDYRIPFMGRSGQNKILKGTIAVTFLYLYYEPVDFDTVKYEFWIKDRNQNYSDTVMTNEIPLSYNGLY